MSWLKVCNDDISVGSAVPYNISGTPLLVMHCNSGFRVFAPICPKAPGFLLHADESECADEGVPRCNRHIGPDGKPAALGVCDAPIFLYASKQADGAVYVDLSKRLIAPYQRITCSPVVKDRRIQALQFNLWTDDERKESIYAAPMRSTRA